MTLPPDSKDTLLEESINEANAMNEGITSLDLDAANASAPDEAAEKAMESGLDKSRQSAGSPEPGHEDSQTKLESIDWDKVGKIYKPESAIEEIIGKEIGRLSKGFDMNLAIQDTENEEKYGKGGKKK